MQDEVFNEGNTPDYEKISYGKFGLRRVQRLRRKGQRRGIEVPYLNYELSKPDKPRIAFWVVAIISAVLFAGVIVAIGLLYNEIIKTSSDLSGIGEFASAMFKPEILFGSFGLSAVPGVFMVLIYVLIIVLLALPVVAAVYFFRFVQGAFYMAKCSKEEFAKGGFVTERIVNIVAVTVVCAIIFFVLISYVAAGAKLYLGLIFGGVMLAFVGLVALMIAERIKCGKWFEGLDGDKKKNYLEHEKALGSVKRRLNFEKRLWSGQ